MTKKQFKKNILCIGAGYVGGPTMAVMAKHCPEYKITVVDIDDARILAWNSDDLPIYEPGLSKIIESVRGKNLFFRNNIPKAIKEADIIFVSVNTPTKDFGVGKGMASNLEYWEKAAREILEYSTTSKIVVEKSTIPVKTAKGMEAIFNASPKKNVRIDVLSNPEFLAEGSAIKDLEKPDRVIIGSAETPEGHKARDELVKVYRNWIPKSKIITTNIWSSELSKLAANAFLAQRISSINAISALCEKTGANVEEVAKAVGADTRIGKHFLKSSIGFGGSCFKKDILNLVYLCRHQGLNEVADYWENVIKVNEYQKSRFVLNMLDAMFNTLAGKRICLFGFAFKADTGDTRDTPALTVAEKLLEEKAILVVTDPKALKNAERDLLKDSSKVFLGTFQKDPYKATKRCDAIAVMTEWNIYKLLDYERIYEGMNKPAFIFDGRNILDHKRLHKIGFNVYPIGKPPLIAQFH